VLSILSTVRMVILVGLASGKKEICMLLAPL
jgi:hypothetical protein